MLLLEHTCDIKRNTAVGTNGRSQLTALYSGVACLSLPMNTTTAIENQFSIGRAYDVFFDSGQDVQQGDQLTIGSNTYMVRSVMPYEVPLVGHVRALCEQEVS